MTDRKCVLQDWVLDLTMMQQSVLITATRGPDGIHKNHTSKLLIRWLRRCCLYSAMDKRVIENPGELGGGSFTGSSITPINHWEIRMDQLVSGYLQTVDELPHHFQLHFMHASEIIGYKHSNLRIRSWWYKTYERLVNDMHLCVESEALMDFRLGDNEKDWRSCEEVTAK